MAVAQGLCTNLLEYAWKINLQLYCPNSAAFTAFMGDVASFTGVVTVAMMFAAPSAFRFLGWRRTARATPNLLLFAGSPFFILCIMYQAMSLYGLLQPYTQPILLTLSVRQPLCPSMPT